jgi:hypothetical protein
MTVVVAAVDAVLVVVTVVVTVVDTLSVSLVVTAAVTFVATGCGTGRYTHTALIHQWTAFDKTKAVYLAHHPYAQSISLLVCYLAAQLGKTGHTIVLDSYFCYISTARGLLAAGHNVVGSFKGTSGVPTDILWEKKDTKQPFGACRGLRSRDGAIGVQQWKDTGVVSVLSTLHRVVSGSPSQIAALDKRIQGPVERNRKDDKGEYSRAKSTRPVATEFYSKYMRYAVCAYPFWLVFTEITVHTGSCYLLCVMYACMHV